MNLIILRIALAIVLLAHSVPTIFDGTIKLFGTEYLDKIGFAPFGLAIAWLIKISHIAAAFAFISNKFVKTASIATIFVLIIGIFMVHLKDGWFVVGGGRNGIEFNFVLIAICLTLYFEK
jgi:putative oxidoreductase